MIGNIVQDSRGRKFEIVNEIGRGAFGIVFLSKDEAGSKFALKLLGSASNGDAYELFEREVGAVASISHPNLLKVISHGEYEPSRGESYYFVVSEFCPDGDYRKLLASHSPLTMPIETICLDFQQILGGLAALHERVIHRDLKPENILRSGAALKIGDFGLSKFVDEATRTLTFKGGGTPRYMAPEIWERNRGTPASDLYAVGVMLFEAAVGHPPFEGPDIIGLRDSHLYRAAPRAKSLRPDLPDRIDGIIRKLLEKDARKRYQSATELSDAIRLVSAPAAPTSVEGIAARIRRDYDAKEAERLRLEEVANRAKDRLARNQYMERQLIELIDQVVDEVNEQIEEVKIVRRRQQHGAMYQLGSRALHVKFFEPEELFNNPEAQGRMEVLRKRHVVHGGLLEIRQGSQDREGWNVVLVRPPQSPYGEWIIVESAVSPLTGKSTKFSPVATEAALFADNLACHWMPAIHTFELKDKLLERADIEKILEKLVP